MAALTCMAAHRLSQQVGVSSYSTEIMSKEPYGLLLVACDAST